jgi:hypothetical protein
MEEEHRCPLRSLTVGGAAISQLGASLAAGIASVNENIAGEAPSPARRQVQYWCI